MFKRFFCCSYDSPKSIFMIGRTDVCLLARPNKTKFGIGHYGRRDQNLGHNRSWVATGLPPPSLSATVVVAKFMI